MAHPLVIAGLRYLARKGIEAAQQTAASVVEDGIELVDAGLDKAEAVADEMRDRVREVKAKRAPRRRRSSKVDP